MAGTTRFGIINRLVGKTIINGNGAYSGAPPRNEDAQYPMENAINGDRFVPWRTSIGPASPQRLQIDAGSNITIQLATLHAFRLGIGTAFPTTCDVSYRTAAQGYGTVWTAFGTISISGRRDSGFIGLSSVLGRYWDFSFGTTATPGFSVAVGVYSIDDMGQAYSPGAEDVVVRSRVRFRTPMGASILSEFGDSHRMLTLPYRSIPVAERDKLLALARLARPFALIMPNDEVLQCELAGDELGIVHRWTPPDLYDVTLELEALA